MESFYSVIYYKTNSLTDEMVSIGLLAGGGEGPFMYVSNARLDLLKKVLHPNTFLSVRRHLRFLAEKVGNHRNEAAGIFLFDPVYTVEQMELLSQRSKNAIVYSQPTIINEWLNGQFFTQLVQSFFGEAIKTELKKRPVFHLKWKAFYHSVKFKTWEKDVPVLSKLNSSPLSITVDLVNQDEKRLIKGIDFNLSETSLSKKLYELELIINSFPDFQVTIIHPALKSKSGKIAFKMIKEKNVKLTFQVFSKFRNLN